MNKFDIKKFRREALLALAYPFFILVVLLVLILPRFLRVPLGKHLSHILSLHRRKVHHIAEDNIEKAFPEMNATQVRAMAKKVIESFIRSTFDFFSSCILVSKKRFFSMVEVEGEVYLKQAYERGKGVICMIPHLSAWELSAVTPPMLEYKTYAASKPIKGYMFNKTFVYLRGRRGMINIDRTGSYARLLDVLNEGNCLIIMADQDTKVKGTFIPFFGREAYTPIGISRMALDTDAAVVPMAMTRKENGGYKFTIYPPLETVRTGDYQADCIENTCKQSAEYERIIRLNPTQWVWMHKRWKTTPEKLMKYKQKKKQENATKR